MREIKFRGYATEEMVYSQWIHGFGISELKFAEHYAKEVGRSSDWWIYTEGGDYRVDPKSIGQYTGLKDKDGREIYEGDVYSYTLTIDGNHCNEHQIQCLDVVKFEDGAFYHGVHLLSDVIEYDDTLTYLGNNFENPELLEELQNGTK